jgi:hypothetical protein
VIFDSGRSHTGALRLKENESDDYTAWMAALIDPLSRAGKAVQVLDNTGHEGDRPRGTSSKEDLFDIVFYMSAPAPFSLTIAGRAELHCEWSRIGELTKGDGWEMELGAGHYGSWRKLSARRPADARGELREAVIEVILAAEGSPIGTERIAAALRARGVKIDDKVLRDALKAWAADPASGITHVEKKGYICPGGQLHLASPVDDLHPTAPGQPSTTPQTPVDTGHTPPVEPSTGAHPGPAGGRRPPVGGAVATGAPQNGTPPDTDARIKEIAQLPPDQQEHAYQQLEDEHHQRATI